MPVAVFAADRAVLRQVDYTLLATFVCFFVFVASVKSYAPISAWLEGLMAGSPLVTSLLVSQVISNVPSAILLSQFTDNYRQLLLGVNIGGVGTLIASLASLITFREYTSHNPGKTGYYLRYFSLFNFAFLVLLVLFVFW